MLRETVSDYVEADTVHTPDDPPWDEPAEDSIPTEAEEGLDAQLEEDTDLQEEKPAESALPQSPVNGTNGHQQQSENGAGALPSSPVNVNAVTTAEATHRLLLRLTETDPEHDKRMLFDVRSILMDYRGECEVTLEISTAGHVVEMEWPAVRVSAGDELITRLNKEVLGSSGEAHLVPAASR